jgi:hypothetical protein
MGGIILILALALTASLLALWWCVKQGTRQLGPMRGFVLALHVTVIGSRMALHNFHLQ